MSSLPETTTQSSSGETWRPILIAAGLIAVVVIASYKFGFIPHLGSTDRSAAIATSISASSCSRTSYYITNRLDGSKASIYDCVMGDGTETCVTQENGLVRDQTATVKLLFESTLGSSRPTCAT